MDKIRDFFALVLHADELLKWGGYPALMLIVFAETGLLVGFFEGDPDQPVITLMFTETDEPSGAVATIRCVPAVMFPRMFTLVTALPAALAWSAWSTCVGVAPSGSAELPGGVARFAVLAVDYE